MEAREVPYHEFIYVSYTVYTRAGIPNHLCLPTKLLFLPRKILDFILFCGVFSSPTLTFFPFTFKAKLK